MKQRITHIVFIYIKIKESLAFTFENTGTGSISTTALVQVQRACPYYKKCFYTQPKKNMAV